MTSILTIGGYGFSEEKFLKSLKENGVESLIDIRQRRGMRGSKYSFLNSSKLQYILKNNNISYIYEKNLSPSTRTRDLQKSLDEKLGVKKSLRTDLSREFKDSFYIDLRDNFSISKFERDISRFRKIAFFCVECFPQACHRSLVAEYVAPKLSPGNRVEHLTP